MRLLLYLTFRLTFSSMHLRIATIFWSSRVTPAACCASSLFLSSGIVCERQRRKKGCRGGWTERACGTSNRNARRMVSYTRPRSCNKDPRHRAHPRHLTPGPFPHTPCLALRRNVLHFKKVSDILCTIRRQHSLVGRHREPGDAGLEGDGMAGAWRGWENLPWNPK